MPLQTDRDLRVRSLQRRDVTRPTRNVGIRDAAMSQKLLIDAKLTLEKAKKAIRQKEAVYEQQRELQGDGSAKDPLVVDEVRYPVARSKDNGRF